MNRLRIVDDDDANVPSQPSDVPVLSLNMVSAFIDESQKYVRQERSIDDYQEHTLHSHIYAKPDTYIGSTFKSVRQDWYLDLNTDKLMYVNIDVQEGMLRLFL